MYIHFKGGRQELPKLSSRPDKMNLCRASPYDCGSGGQAACVLHRAGGRIADACIPNIGDMYHSASTYVHDPARTVHA